MKTQRRPRGRRKSAGLVTMGGARPYLCGARCRKGPEIAAAIEREYRLKP